MTTIYTKEEVRELESPRIKKTETKEITSYTSKEDVERRLERVKTQYNAIVDEMEAINAGIKDSIFKTIPNKLK